MKLINRISFLFLVCLLFISCEAQTTTKPSNSTTITTSKSNNPVKSPATSSGTVSTTSKTAAKKKVSSSVKSSTGGATTPTKIITGNLTKQSTSPSSGMANTSTSTTKSNTSSGMHSGDGRPINNGGAGPQNPTFPSQTSTSSNTNNSPTSTNSKSDKTGGTTTNTTPTPAPSSPSSGGKGDKMGNGGSTTTNTTPTNDKSGKAGGSTSSGGNTTGGVGDILSDILTGGGPFTEGDAAKAIKEALMKGINIGVDKVSVTNGYFGNSMIKIPFPKEAQIVETTLRQVGMGSMIDNVVLSCNRAAESAAKQALPIFANSITQMTITDAVNIVSNKQSDAATQFLQRTTTEPLVSAFKPSIKSALDKTLATKYWSDVMGYYNKIPFVQKVNPDLTDFVTRKAISGLFYMVAQEEGKIRKDPAARTTEILKKVFGQK